MRQLVQRIEQAAFLDPIAGEVAVFAKRLTAPRAVKNALSGVWLGHRFHPLLVAIPMGAWTSALVFDLVATPAARSAADLLVGFGVLSALPTVATGESDFADLHGAEQRVAFVHAAANTTALSAYILSLASRSLGWRGLGFGLSLLGMGAVSVGGYLGGHLTYRMGTGVDRTAFEPTVDDWTPTVPELYVGEGQLRLVGAGEAQILLVRTEGQIFALSAVCNHAGGPLQEGTLCGSTVRCPWHGSEFRLSDGSVVQAPAAGPQRSYETRVVGGIVQVRARPD